MKSYMLIIAIALFGLGCSSGGSNESGESQNTENAGSGIVETTPAKDIGVGPITKVDLGETIDSALVAKGREVFDLNCTSCHKVDKRFVGPALAGVTQRREPEWIMNMILNPEKMVVENEAAKQLLMEYSAPMANQNISEENARAILEYFRTL